MTTPRIHLALLRGGRDHTRDDDRLVSAAGAAQELSCFEIGHSLVVPRRANGATRLAAGGADTAAAMPPAAAVG